MNIKTVNRTIRPDTHVSDNSYRVKIGKRNFYDQLIVNINHEKLNFKKTYVFDGKQIADYESIHFKAIVSNEKVIINWMQNLEYEIL